MSELRVQLCALPGDTLGVQLCLRPDESLGVQLCLSCVDKLKEAILERQIASFYEPALPPWNESDPTNVAREIGLNWEYTISEYQAYINYFAPRFLDGNYSGGENEPDLLTDEYVDGIEECTDLYAMVCDMQATKYKGGVNPSTQQANKQKTSSNAVWASAVSSFDSSSWINNTDGHTPQHGSALYDKYYIQRTTSQPLSIPGYKSIKSMDIYWFFIKFSGGTTQVYENNDFSVSENRWGKVHTNYPDDDENIRIAEFPNNTCSEPSTLYEVRGWNTYPNIIAIRKHDFKHN
jgi:hypothetical protein